MNAELFVAQEVLKLYSRNGLFSHILCSFVRAICQTIDHPEQLRQNKMFQIVVQVSGSLTLAQEAKRSEKLSIQVECCQCPCDELADGISINTL